MGEPVLCLWKTAALGLMNQVRFKLTFINKPNKLLNLRVTPRMALKETIWPGLSQGFCPSWALCIYFIPFVIGLCLINVLNKIYFFLPPYHKLCYNMGSILIAWPSNALCPPRPYHFLSCSVRLCHVPMACTATLCQNNKYIGSDTSTTLPSSKSYKKTFSPLKPGLV
jgi:hypothetical protein